MHIRGAVHVPGVSREREAHNASDRRRDALGVEDLHLLGVDEADAALSAGVTTAPRQKEAKVGDRCKRSKGDHLCTIRGTPLSWHCSLVGKL